MTGPAPFPARYHPHRSSAGCLRYPHPVTRSGAGLFFAPVSDVAVLPTFHIGSP